MNWLEHEYLVPVIIGNGRYAISAAKTIYRTTRIRPHIFSESFSVVQGLFGHCHKVSPMRAELLIESLASFADSLEEYCFPVIICGVETEKILNTYSDIIESFYIVKKYDDTNEKGEWAYDEN